VLCLLLIFLPAHAASLTLSSPTGQFTIGFTEADYQVDEENPAGVPLVIQKSGANIGDIDIQVMFLTEEMFLQLGVPRPTNRTENPAECTYVNKYQIANSVLRKLSFPLL